MLCHRGFEAWITSEGRYLPLYEPVVDKERHRVTCWLASEAGQRFVIHWKDHGSKVDSAAYITLDGLKVPGRFLFGEGETYRSGIRAGKDTERPFVFAKVQDEGASTSTDPDVDPKQLGMIALRIRRIKRTGGHPVNPIMQDPAMAKGKSKALDVRVGFGPESKAQRRTKSTWSIESYDKESPGSYVTFVFRYRPREFLEDQGLALLKAPMPRSPKVEEGASQKLEGIESRAGTVPLTPGATPSPMRTSSKRLRRTPSSTESRKSRRTDLTSSASSLSSVERREQAASGGHSGSFETAAVAEGFVYDVHGKQEGEGTVDLDGLRHSSGGKGLW
ncbi:hypothetical protein BV25DRAFT_1822819 [Artomyces pyxidatus]|uniref:Uncharacterized protein n=1 Tax=Artomyces pyxidatus TaxID=48021 RepID=A0ACB8T7R2_9AGAM|nr:hypothetical protein BV25DRAFT_1822819 [Artomyces pyxidatus]